MGLRIRLIAYILPFVCHFFLSLKAKFMSLFSPELCKLGSLNMVYICRVSNCIVGLRLRVMAFSLLFLSIFLSIPILHVHIKRF